MKIGHSLRRYITIRLAGLTLFMVACYSVLLWVYIMQGLEVAASYHIRLIGYDFVSSYKKNKNTPLPKGRFFTSYLGEKKLPESIRTAFPRDIRKSGKVVIKELPALKPNFPGEKDHIMFLTQALGDGQNLYILNRYTPGDEHPEAFSWIETLILSSWCIGVGFIVLVILIIRYLLKQTIRPVNRLTKWAGRVDHHSLSLGHPDFGYREVNRLADLIHESMRQLNEALEREHRFLANASHELRTPLAIVLSNAQLLTRIHTKPGTIKDQAISRIQRAGDNMNHIIKTLLWLSRKHETALPQEPVNLNSIIKEIIEENRFLLRNKSITIHHEGPQIFIHTAITPFRIALSNLIRNAFQYTFRGSVFIRTEENAVTVKNLGPVSGTNNRSAEVEYGFGLGLFLVEQLSQRLGWFFETRIIPGGWQARLKIIPPIKTNEYST